MNAAAPHAQGLWIDGESVPASDGKTFKRRSPWDDSEVGVFADGTAEDAERAVSAARRAFDEGEWATSSARTRFDVLRRTASLLEEHSHDVGLRMTLESGKPITVAHNEVASSVRTFEFYAGLALEDEGSAMNGRRADGLGLVFKEPVGVAGLITPWNFPILNPTNKIAPALAAGCTVVIKPSHLCSGPVLLLAEYLQQAGLPRGAFNVVTSERERGGVVGQAISLSPRVDKIAFTGSTRTGQAVMRAAASTTKRVSLELGGKSANIVFADATWDDAVRTSANAFCFNSGQQCSAATRLLVERSIHDEFIQALVAEVDKQKVGDPMDPATTMGPLVSPEQFERVQSYLELGRQEGRVVAGGEAPESLSDGPLLVEPTIVDDVDNSSRLGQEEVFGPVLAVVQFDSEEEAIRLANESAYGLAGGVWTQSIDRALRVVRAVRTGKMFVNCYNDAGLDDLPHGGYKDSGIGREQGPEGLAEYQELKTVQIRIR